MDHWSLGEARKGYTEGAGPTSPGHAIPLPPLTLANARLSLSLLRMCRKAFWSPKTRLHPAGGRMRKTWVTERCPFLSSKAVSTAHEQYACLSPVPAWFWVRACAAGMSPCPRAAKRRGRSGRETPGSAGAGRGPRARKARQRRAPNVRCGHAPRSCPLLSGRAREGGGPWAQPISCGGAKKAGKSGSKRSLRWRRGPGWGGWAKGRAGPQVTQAGPQSRGDPLSGSVPPPKPHHPHFTSLKGRP